MTRSPYNGDLYADSVPLRRYLADHGQRSHSSSLVPVDARFDSTPDRFDVRYDGLDLQNRYTAGPLLDYPSKSRPFIQTSRQERCAKAYLFLREQ